MKKLGLVKEIIFDARGAYFGELTEYNVVESETIRKNILSIEKKALEESDAQLAVSNKLVNWWKKFYGFEPKHCEVIPCTLSKDFLQTFPAKEALSSLRSLLGFSENDKILVYSGSSAGWQSFELVDTYLEKVLSGDPSIKLVFLSNEEPKSSKTFSRFRERIVKKWVEPNEVRNLLLACDYGLLIREESVTNIVASPVKFAEYLSCGLQIIISKQIGDFSEFVQKNNCGFEFSSLNKIESASYETKLKNYNLVLQHFNKNSEEIRKAYGKLVS